MRIKNLLQVIILLFAVSGPLSAQTLTECISGATISAQGNVSELSACQGDGEPDVFRFRTSTLAMPFGYIVTDEDNNILLVSISSVIDLEGLPSGTLRVWAFSFLGELIAEPGMNAETDQLGSICSALTENFITINSAVPDGGVVSTDDGQTSVVVCAGDGNPDVITFTTTSSNAIYTYLVTDEDDNILAVVDGDSFDFDDAPAGICRVYGLSHLGAVIAQPGDNLNNTQLAEDCYDLSDNYIEVIRLSPDGGTVSLTSGATDITVCVGDGLADLLEFQTTSTSSNPYLYVITDENNIILGFAAGNSADFEDAPAGISRVWGLSYTGNLLALPGDDAAAVELSDDCYELSENFITVNSIDVDGATVSLDDGTTDITVCVNDGDPDLLTFINTSGSAEAYAYVITDENNIILGFADGNSADFEGAETGICRVWGLSYSGVILAQAGDDAAATVLTDECYELSTNFITVNRKEVDGGAVRLSDGSTEITVCVNDGVADVLTFENTSASGEAYVYVITDENNIILDFATGNSADFEDAAGGICRVWGLSYTGNVLAAVGDNAAAVPLTDECYELSENFITVNRKDVEGGMISLENGSTAVNFCTDGVSNQVTVVTTSTSAETYSYVLTDENNTILSVLGSNIVDFTGAPAGAFRIWGLSYSGNLTAQGGDNAAEATLSDECYELSENFITVTIEDVDGGAVSLDDGTTGVVVCVNDDVPDELFFINTSTAGVSYVYVITDENNFILGFTDTGSFDFSNALPGICRVWGLSYTGTITATIGDNAAEVPLSTECYELSENFITVNRKDVDGATVSLLNGDTEVTYCVGDGISDIAILLNTTSSDEFYAYLITDEDNNIEDIPAGNLYDFENWPSGVSRIWGLSFSGTLTAMPGDNAAEVALSDECYELSENFITVIRKDVDGGTVSLAGGATEASVCANDGIADVVTVENTSVSTENYLYVVTDEDNNILSVATSPEVDLGDSELGVCRIWGLSYSGNLTAQIGDNAGAVTLTDECYELSANFITVTKKEVIGGEVSLDDGSTAIDLCVNDGLPDVLTFVNSSTATESYAYIITDEENNILAYATSGTFDFEGSDAGVCRVWGVSYSGTLTTTTGVSAAEIALSDECFELSNNFITINRIVVDGAFVLLDSGTDFAEVCTGDGIPDELTFANTSTAGNNYVYVITDEENNIITISFSSTFDFDEAGDGICRVWGLSYTGDLLAGTGDNAAEVALSDGCFNLSDNFVIVDRNFVDGSTVSLDDGSTSTFICASDDLPNELTFTNASTAADAAYAYVVTTETNNILVVLDGPSVGFGGVPVGNYRVWGLSYTGNVIANTGDNAGAVPLSDGCFELSANFVSVVVDEVVGGTVAAAGTDATTLYTCPDDGNPDVITFENAGAQGIYAYVITDEDNVILGFADGDSFDFDGAPAGICRVWGLAFSGNVLAEVGDDADDTGLTDGCYELSDNFLTIIRETPDGGTVAMPNGETVRYVCPDNDTPDIVMFDSTGTSSGPYAYVITDENNIILDFPSGDSFDFNTAPAGICRVWGLAYTGTLTAQIGDDAAATALSDDCFDLSDNFIEVIRETPDGGSISTPGGQTEVVTCDGDGEPDLVAFIANGASNSPYAFVVTDLENNIIAFVDGDIYDFEGGTLDSVRVWGVAYTGNVTAQVGDNAGEVALSDDCFDLSDNFILVYRGVPSAGTISTAGGQNELDLCIGDGNPDLVVFDVQGASDAPYLFLITDENDFLLGTTTGDMFDFDNVTAGGTYRIYGLSYTGQFQAFPGDNIFGGFPLATGCFEVTPNFIQLNTTLVDGGLLFTPSGQTTFYTCPGDGVDDIIQFNNTSSAVGSDYVYLLTGPNNGLLGILANGPFNFETAGVGVTRIWGVSYTGSIIAGFGSDVTQTTLSDGCFALSENFITVSRDNPFGGNISTTDGQTEVQLCIGADDSTLAFETTSTSLAGYAFVLTDEFNDVIAVSADNTFDFLNQPVGAYRVWGLSYTGNLLLQPGDNLFGPDPASSCYEISGNFVEIYRAPALDGGAISTLTGEEEFYTCTGNGISDLIVLLTTSDDPNYRFLITDTANVVQVAAQTSNLIDFEGAPENIYRIWGLSFSGDLSAPITGLDADIDALSDSCFALSENFITVNVSIPAGGFVTTAEGAVDTSIVLDNVPDPITFVSQDASNSLYVYLVTDDQNIIQAIVDDTNTFDFESFTPGFYRVWGLAYTGELLAQVGDDAAVAILSDECYALSDNFVTVAEAIPFAGGDAELTARSATDEEALIAELRLAPNPVISNLTVNFRIMGTPAQPASTVQVFSATGGEVLRRQLATATGNNFLELDVSSLPSGLYVLYVRNGKTVQQTKFLKQE